MRGVDTAVLERAPPLVQVVQEHLPDAGINTLRNVLLDRLLIVAECLTERGAHLGRECPQLQRVRRDADALHIIAVPRGYPICDIEDLVTERKGGLALCLQSCCKRVCPSEQNEDMNGQRKVIGCDGKIILAEIAALQLGSDEFRQTHPTTEMMSGLVCEFKRIHVNYSHSSVVIDHEIRVVHVAHHITHLMGMRHNGGDVVRNGDGIAPIIRGAEHAVAFFGTIHHEQGRAFLKRHEITDEVSIAVIQQMLRPRDQQVAVHNAVESLIDHCSQFGFLLRFDRLVDLGTDRGISLHMINFGLAALTEGVCAKLISFALFGIHFHCFSPLLCPACPAGAVFLSLYIVNSTFRPLLPGGRHFPDCSP